MSVRERSFGGLREEPEQSAQRRSLLTRVASTGAQTLHYVRKALTERRVGRYGLSFHQGLLHRLVIAGDAIEHLCMECRSDHFAAEADVFLVAVNQQADF